MSLLRQLVFIIPLAWILGQLGGLGAVWFCYPAAELLVALIFVPIALKTIKKSFEAERRKPGHINKIPTRRIDMIRVVKV